MTGLLRVTEATFGRQVRRATLPVLVCWGMRGCPARQALRLALERIATAYAGRMQVATVLLDAAPLLAELYGVTASPTLMVFQHGERQGQVIGFLPDGLMDLLAAAVVQGAVTGDIHWSPVEAQLEDVVLIPLLARWGYTVQRQVGCVLAGRGTLQRGRIDLLVYADPATPPLTLIESKRAIRSDKGHAASRRTINRVIASMALRISSTCRLSRQVTQLSHTRMPSSVDIGRVWLHDDAARGSLRPSRRIRKT